MLGGESRFGQLRRKLRMLLAKTRRFKIKSWILLLFLVPLGFVDATLLRLNHIKMTELRDKVLEVDAKISENETDEEMKVTDEELAKALGELKEFTFSHIVINIIEENGTQKISFGTGPFYLEHKYLRAANKALEEAEKKLSGDGNPYGNVYGEAGEICRGEAIANGWTWDSSEFINCMLSEIQKYPSASDIQDTIIASLPSTELFRRNYASPIFVMEPAWVCLFLTAVIILILAIRVIYWIVIRIALIFV